MRLFVAIDLPDPVRRALVQLVRPLHDGGVRWLPPGALHLTLKFLGEVPDADVPGVTEAFATAVGAREPFDLVVGGFGRFPPRGRPRVLWAGVGDHPALGALAEDLDGAFVPFGIAPEARAFHPHVTLGRVKGDAGHAVRALAATGQLGTVPVREVVLFRSELRPDGARHHPLARVALGAHA